MTSRFRTDKEIKEMVAALLREVAPDKSPPWKPRTFSPNKPLIAAFLFFGAILLAIFLFIQSTAPDYSGRITDPPPGSEVGRRISISGYTENLPPEYPYAIIAVDVPDLGLTWHKKPFIEPNTKFRVTFKEGGPQGPCKVSLYAVTPDMHQKITAWFQEQRLSGMPLFPNRYRLGSIVVLINNLI